MLILSDKLLKIHTLARYILVAFILTFTIARILVFLIMDKKIPDFYLYLGSTHIHHLNYGIFLLSGICGFLIFTQPSTRALKIIALLYGIALALTFDEFGMWLHLGGGYWQRASFDVITVISAILLLLTFIPPLKFWQTGHYGYAAIIMSIVTIFFILFMKSLNYVENRYIPRMQKLEGNGPK